MNFLKTSWSRFSTWFSRLVTARPLITFVVGLAVLVALIVVGDRLRQPAPPAAEPEPVAQAVEVYEVGGTPTLMVQAKVEKSGVVKIVAQTSGVVQKIKVTEGGRIKRGQAIVSLSTSPNGGNIAALTSNISSKNYQFLVDTYDAQKQLIQRSRDMAIKAEAQSSELREIARQSYDETKGLIALNEDIVKGLDAQIRTLEQTNVGGANDAVILQFKQAKAGTLSALNGLKSGQRSAEYANSNDQEAAQLAVLTKDQALQQLDLQEKTLALNKDLAQLNLRISQISASLMSPSSTCPGVVERIHVKVGEVVNPGTVIATIKSDDNDATAVVRTSQAIAESVSLLEPSYVTIDGQAVAITPRYISTEPTEGSFHTILYSLPELYRGEVTNNSYVEIKLPVGAGKYQQSQKPFIPIDAIYQTQDKALVNVVSTDETGHAVAKSEELQLGAVTGQFVEVLSGLNAGDRVIINRSILDGQRVSVKE